MHSVAEVNTHRQLSRGPMLFLNVLIIAVTIVAVASIMSVQTNAQAPTTNSLQTTSCTSITAPVPGGGQTTACLAATSGQLTCAPPYTTCSTPPPNTSSSTSTTSIAGFPLEAVIAGILFGLVFVLLRAVRRRPPSVAESSP